MNRYSRLQLILKISGPVGLIRFIVTRLLGQSDLMRPASTVDIRRSGLVFSNDVEDFVLSLVGDLGNQLTDDLMLEALEVNKSVENRAKALENEFPINWNSEGRLRVALYLLVRILRPALVVETGTANGSSAAAICAGLAANDFGKLISVDVKDSSAVLVGDESRKFLELKKTQGTSLELEEICKNGSDANKGIKIFLHDSDHSYFGQYEDYTLAARESFNIILSDDIDASLAFTDFSGYAGKALFDTRKIIGGVKFPF
jgi:hypothetical protein